jgi:putative tryptophan/tyrosine transport system substrate-binding protein
MMIACRASPAISSAASRRCSSQATGLRLLRQRLLLQQFRLFFFSGPDPERAGLVDRLNRPGGNATGISIFTTGLGPKRLEILRELVPSAALIAFVVNPDNASTRAQVEEVTAAAKAVGQQIVVLTAGTEQQIDQVFQSIAQRKVNMVGF